MKMGIHSLTKLIQQYSPESISHKSLYHFKNKKIAIDTSIFIYKSLMNVRSNGDYLRNNEGKVMSHIIGLFNKIVLWKSYGIEPIFIFDGKPPDEKKNILDSRNKKAKESKDKMLLATNNSDKIKHEKASIRITKEYINDLENLFSKMGVSYIHSTGEAEAYAAELCRIGYVDAVISEDMDTLVFDCPVLVRSSIQKKVKKRHDSISIFSLQTLLNDIHLDHSQFIDLCILCGCDYCPTIPKIGYSRAFTNIKKYHSIENMILSNKFDIPDDFKEKYQSARNLFSIFKNKIIIDEIPIISSEYNEVILSNFLIQECNMNSKRIQTALKKLKPI